MDSSRGLKDRVIRGLAKVGLVWAVAVLGFMFTATAAAGVSPSPDPASTSFSFVNDGEAPRTAGLVLALGVLGGGLMILVVGSLRDPEPGREVVDEDLAVPREISLGIRLGLAPYRSAA